MGSGKTSLAYMRGEQELRRGINPNIFFETKEQRRNRILKKVTSLTLPRDLHNRLLDYCEKRGLYRSEVMRRALKEYLDKVA